MCLKVYSIPYFTIKCNKTNVIVDDLKSNSFYRFTCESEEALHKYE